MTMKYVVANDLHDDSNSFAVKFYFADMEIRKWRDRMKNKMLQVIEEQLLQDHAIRTLVPERIAVGRFQSVLRLVALSWFDR